FWNTTAPPRRLMLPSRPLRRSRGRAQRRKCESAASARVVLRPVSSSPTCAPLRACACKRRLRLLGSALSQRSALSNFRLLTSPTAPYRAGVAIWHLVWVALIRRRLARVGPGSWARLVGGKTRWRRLPRAWRRPGAGGGGNAPPPPRLFWWWGPTAASPHLLR